MTPPQTRMRSRLHRSIQMTFGARSLYWFMLPFAGGLGLVAWALAKASMPVLVGAFALTGAAMWAFGRYQLRPAQRAELATRVRVGLVGGAIATVLYDLARFGLVSLVQWSLKPWAAIPLFGAAFIGPHHSTAALYTVGLIYHLCLNGVGFGVAYTIIARRPHPLSGLLWAYGLEAAMALLYPSFLIIKQYGEFLTMSVVGHTVYGLVLGWYARRMLPPGQDNPTAERSSQPAV